MHDLARGPVAGIPTCALWVAAGKLHPGPETERAFLERHKWAARRAAPWLRDMHRTPPLGWLADAQALLSLATTQGDAGVQDSLLPASLVSGAISPAGCPAQKCDWHAAYLQHPGWGQMRIRDVHLTGSAGSACIYGQVLPCMGPSRDECAQLTSVRILS